MTEYLPDIYKISETIKEIQSKFIEEEEILTKKSV